MQREPAFAPDGSMGVRITYDHRVLHGCTIACALVELERVLTHEILDELRESQETETGYRRAGNIMNCSTV